MYTSLNQPSSSSSSNSPPQVNRHASVLGAASGLWSDVKQVFRKSQTSIGPRLNRQDESRYDPPRYPGSTTERPPTVSPEVAMDLLRMDAANVLDRLPECRSQGNGGATSSTHRPRPRAARSALEAYRIRSSAPDDLLDLDSASRSSAEPQLISLDDVAPSNPHQQFSPSYPSTVPVGRQTPLFAAGETVGAASTRVSANALSASGIPLPSASSAAAGPTVGTLASPGSLSPWDSAVTMSLGPTQGSLSATPPTTASFSSQSRSPKAPAREPSGTHTSGEEQVTVPPPSCLPTIIAPPNAHISAQPSHAERSPHTSCLISDDIATTATTNLDLLDL